jgi:hypothetical protein
MLIVGTKSGVIHDGDIPGPRGYSWGFVAMEYYALILNRMMAVLISSRNLTVVRVGDVVMAPRQVTPSWYEPLAYLTNRMASRYAPVAVESDELLKIDRSNRRVALATIGAVSFEHRAKWGMGSVPHSGLIYLENGNGRTEFILVGNQDGKEIAAKLRAALTAA